jgi:hypothetical protein
MPPDARIVWRDWPEGSVIFDRELGDTHSLSRLGAALLRELLLDHHRPDQDLRQRLALADPDLPMLDFDSTLRDTRGLIQRLGLG